MASTDASGYGSDEEVYATAKAVDDADGYDETELDSLDKKKIEPLVALDHANMEYDDFAKDFYEEPPALKALSFPEVWSLPNVCLPSHSLQASSDSCSVIEVLPMWPEFHVAV